MVVHLHTGQVIPFFWLTRLSCLNRGIFVSWHDGDADCQEPLIVDDDQLTVDLPQRRNTYPSGKDAPFCLMTVFYCQMKFAQALTRVIQCAFGLKTRSYAEILRLDNETENYLRQTLPTCLAVVHRHDPLLTSVRTVTEFFDLKIALLLHRPFITRSHENVRLMQSRRRAVESALRIVNIQKKISSMGAMFFENHWNAKVMVAHGLFLAPVTLALELYTHPDQQQDSILEALIDIRSFYAELSVHFIAAKRLYKIINLLMQKAWEKAGLTLPLGIETLSTTTLRQEFFEYVPRGMIPSLQQFQLLNLYGPRDSVWDNMAESTRSFLPNLHVNNSDSDVPFVEMAGGTMTPGNDFDPESNNSWVFYYHLFADYLAERNRLGCTCEFNRFRSCT
jgi:hypothetical protein